MQGTWSTSAGLDVHLDLSGTRPRARLESALRDAVRSGQLAAGAAMPPSRSLARDLGVARNTVAQAYAQLVAEGWLSARHGSGTWVAQRAEQPPPARSPAASGAAARGLRYDLRPGTPDLTAFPRAAWLAAARKALAAAPAADLGYADPRGLEVLRVALAEYLGRARGVRVTPDRVVVCAGFKQGLELICEVLHASGARTLAVESYGPSGHRQIVARTGLRLASLPVDDSGAGVAALTSQAGGVLLTPAHQFPLGVALAPERRRQVADWAVRNGGVVI